jgi:hypothetical protein
VARSQYVIRGAALGAIVGAVAGWVYTRYGAAEKGAGKKQLETGELLRVGTSIAAVVKQLLDLG